MARNKSAAQRVKVDSPNEPFYHRLTNNSTKTSLDTEATTTTEPVTTDDSGTPTSNTLVVDMNGNTHVHVIPFGRDAANEAFNIRVVGWKSVPGSSTATVCWVPTTLWESLVTLGAMVGVDGSTLENEDFLADTIADDTAAVNDHRLSRAADDAAGLVIDCRGAEKVEIDFDLTTAAGANALVAVL